MNRRILLASVLGFLAWPIGPVTTMSQVGAPTGTVYEPSATDPRIVAAMAARRRMEEPGQGTSTFEALFAPDLVVNSPINKVVTRENVLARMRTGQISYEEDAQVVVEFVGVRGDFVVIMGEEIVKPNRNAPNVGKTVRRRFTDIWRDVGGAWKLTVRQATVTSVQ